MPYELTIDKNFEINAPADSRPGRSSPIFPSYGEWNPFVREAKVDLASRSARPSR